MISSKNIDDLMPSVAANLRVFVSMMAARGYKVAFACILRDQEKQTQLNKAGIAPALVSFHWGGGQGKGLAFDIYQDAPTYAKQWKDAGFWKAARELLTLIGFSPVSGEESHSQWDDHKKYTSSMIRAGKLPGAMPLYKAPAATSAIVIPAAVLRKGSTGADVVTLQNRLTALRFPCGKSDGDFGARTLEAVKAFQAARGLVADGVVGPISWKALLA